MRPISFVIPAFAGMTHSEGLYMDWEDVVNVMPEIKSSAPWRVSNVEQVQEWTLKVIFRDGLTGTVRFEQSCFTGVFEVLKDPIMFKQAYVDHGAVTWPGELDLAPDAMYDEIKAHGEWVSR
jgi:hypothetical protein